MKKTAILTVGFLCMASGSSAFTLVNGGFDATSGAGIGQSSGTDLKGLADGSARSSWDIFNQLSGWETGKGGAGVEIQTNATLSGIDAQSGGFYVELDTTKNSNIYQDLTLDRGKYQLSFYYAPRVSTNLATNRIAYSIGDLSGSISGHKTKVKPGEWTKVTEYFKVDQNNTNVRLAFAAKGKSDSYGGLLDTVNLVAVPLPATLALMGVAMAGLIGFGARRRKTKA